MTQLQTQQIAGWFQINSEGIATLYFSIIDEGIVTAPGDTPSNGAFRPRVLNPEQFSIRRAPQVWVWGNSRVQAAAVGTLQIDNYDGAYDQLLSADLRDTSVIIKLVKAGSLLTGTTMHDAPTMVTAIIDDIRSDDEDVITITLKDTIARLDKTLPASFNPPYVEPNAANQMIPMGFGPRRNVPAQLIDSANRLFYIADANVPNISAVSDKAAILDPTVPQYTPALSGWGIQLQTMPVGRLAVDCSSVGVQATIPGTADVLAGSGAFPGTAGSGAWLGRNGYDTTTSGAITGSTTYTIPTTALAPANGQKIYVTDGTNSIYATIASGGGTHSIVTSATGQVTTGTPTSIPSGSVLVIPGAPDGWTFSKLSGTITERLASLAAFLGTNNAAQLISDKPFSPYSGLYGDQLATENPVLDGGVSYRVTFSVFAVVTAPPALTDGVYGGLVVATALTSNPDDYITGIANPIRLSATRGNAGAQTFTLEFKAPIGAARKLYFVAAPSSGATPSTSSGSVSLWVYGVRLEKLGQYISLPLSAISMTNYFTEILVNRGGEDPSVFNSADTDALMIRDKATPDGVAGSLIPFGVHFDAPPNMLDALRMPLDSCCAALFTDNLGVLRCRRLSDPSNPDTRPAIKCDFSMVNVERPIKVSNDRASGLTTIFGARRNWQVFTPADFVTDQALVPQDVKMRYSRKSQFQITSSQTPAAQYSFAINAIPQFDTIFDIANDCQIEADRVVAIFSPQIYTNGVFGTGKRQVVRYTAFWDDPLSLGVNTTCAVTDLLFGDAVSFDYPTHSFNNTPGIVRETELFPFAQKIIIAIEV